MQDAAVTAQKLTLEKTPGLGSRIDIVLTIVRIGFFFGDHELITSQLKQADKYANRLLFPIIEHSDSILKID